MSDKKRTFASDYRFLAQATLHRMWPKDRRLLIQLADKHVKRKTLFFTAVLVCITYFTCFVGPAQFIFQRFDVSDWFLEIIDGLFVSIIVLCWFYLSSQQEKMYRNYFRRELRRKGIRTHFCLKCDYNFRGVESNTCPECGALLAPLETQEHFDDEDFAPPEDHDA